MHAFPRAYVLRQVVNHSTKKITRFSLYFVVCPFLAIKARPKTPTRGKSFALFLPYGPIWARVLLFLSDFVYKIGRYKAVKVPESITNAFVIMYLDSTYIKRPATH